MLGCKGATSNHPRSRWARWRRPGRTGLRQGLRRARLGRGAVARSGLEASRPRASSRPDRARLGIDRTGRDGTGMVGPGGRWPTLGGMAGHGGLLGSDPRRLPPPCALRIPGLAQGQGRASRRPSRARPPPKGYAWLCRSALALPPRPPGQPPAPATSLWTGRDVTHAVHSLEQPGASMLS